MNVVIAPQPLQISEIRDVRRCEVSPNNFITVADVVLEGAALPISVDVNSLSGVELASLLDTDPTAEARETAEDMARFGSQEPTLNLEIGNFPLQTPNRHVTREWARRHLNVDVNGFAVELDRAFGKGNWTLSRGAK